MRTAFSTSLRFSRQARVPTGRRFASSQAESVQKKAQDALAGAQKTAEKLLESARGYLGPAGEKAASMLGAYRQPITYNLSVTKEILKLVYQTERLQPPTLAEVRSAYSTLYSRASSRTYWRQLVNSGDWAKVGLYAMEAYGIYKIGEIIGRRSLVGYSLKDH